MKGKRAGFLFLMVCIVLTVLLLARVVAPLTSGIVFAVALIVLGGLSRKMSFLGEPQVDSGFQEAYSLM